MVDDIFNEIITTGIALAALISWYTYHSVLWAILHGCCGWLYVIYYCLTKLY